MNIFFDPKLPDAAALQEQACTRMPGFSFDYLEGGSHDEIGQLRNINDIQAVQLRSQLLKPFDHRICLLSCLGINTMHLLVLPQFIVKPSTD